MMLENVTIILKSSLWVIIPVLIGGIFGIIELFRKAKTDEIRTIEKLITKITILFIRGSLLIFLQTFLINSLTTPLKFLSLLQIVIFSESIFGLLVLALLLIKHKKRIRIDSKELLGILTIIFISIIGYTLWSQTSGKESVINWDMFMHQATVYEIAEGKLDLNTKLISDTYNFYSYTPFFHTLVLAGQVFNIPTDFKVTEFWWGAQYFHYLWTILASYIVVKQLSKSRTAGIFGALLGAFVFESIMAYTSLVLIPQTLVGTLFVIMLMSLANKENSKKIISINELSLIVFVTLGHFIIGVGALAILLFNKIFWLLQEKIKNEENWNLAILIISILTIPALYLLTNNLNLGAMNRGEGSAFSLPISLKLEYLQAFYGYILWLLLPIGTVFALFSKKKTEIIFGTALAFFTLAIIFTNIPYIIKYYVLTRYFVQFVIAFGIYKLVEKMTIFHKGFVAILLMFVLITIFSANSMGFKDSFTYDQKASHVKQEELEVAKALTEEGYDKDIGIMLISDPTTMHALEGITGINTPGGAFTTEKTRSIVSKIYTSRDTRLMNKQLFKISDRLEKARLNKILLVISGRFSNWQLAEEEKKLGVVFNSWQPKDLTYYDFEFIDFLDRSEGFRKIYTTEGIIVYEVSR